MTAGTVVVAGPTGSNLAAGMTGGRLVVHDLDVSRLNTELVEVADPDAELLAELRTLLERHVRYTGSTRVEELLANWERAQTAFALVEPRRSAEAVEGGAAEARAAL
jgi:glutamate synthase domain-containing protein 3